MKSTLSFLFDFLDCIKRKKMLATPQLFSGSLAFDGKLAILNYVSKGHDLPKT